jgi:glycosyltransferase involved in cell wall biosynthesis
MKIAFYHELPVVAGVGMREVLDGATPSSGGQGRIWVAVELGRMQQEVIVFHRASAGPKREQIHGILTIRVESDDDFVAELKKLDAVDCVVINYYEGIPALVEKLASIDSCKILWAGCNPPFEWCDYLDQKRLHRLVCVSDVCREPYRLHRNFKWVDYIYSSMNGSVRVPKPVEPLHNSVAFLGALREEKGFHHVLPAWPFVRSKVPDAKLYVCGSIRLHIPDAPVGRTGVLSPEFERKHLEPWIGQDGDWRAGGIEFLYPLTKEALFERLARTAVGIVNPNLTGSVETYCLSAVEMQACGCPCIGGGVGGLLETVDNGNSGFLLKTQHPQELADCVVKVLVNQSLRATLSVGALRHSAKLSSSIREAEDWIRIIEASLARTPAKYSQRGLIDLGRNLGMGYLETWLRLQKKRLNKYLS